MKKSLLCLSIGLLSFLSSSAVLKTWIGASGGSWSIGTNWLPSGAPGSSDDVEINTTGTIVIDVNPNILSLLISASGTVQFTANAARTVTVSSISTTTPGLKINAGATLQMSQSAASLFDISLTGSVGVTGRIYGTLQFTGSNASASAKLVLFSGPVANGNAIIYSTGIIQYDTNTGNTTGNGLTGLQIEAGGQYIVNRNGGAMPAGTYNNGSIIRINGVVSNMFNFNTTATYQGLIIWNCPSQTISGSSAIILPSTSFALIDSLRIVSTGTTGTVRLATNPTAFVIGHLEVQGGTLELSAPGSASSSGSITTDLVISGGTVIGNATYAFDNLASYPMTFTVNGNFTMSGSSAFNFTNRPTGNSPGGAFILNIKGNASQTAGTISSTSAFGSQNQFNMNGTSPQNLQLYNIINTISLVILNTTGVSLQNDLVLPYYLNLQQGYLQLNSNNCTVTYPQIFLGIASPYPKVVTNGFGKLRVLNIPGGGFLTFPVGPNASSYNPITISPQASAATNSYYVRVETGNNPTGIFNTGKTVNRTWIINGAAAIAANTVDITNIQYSVADVNGSCNPTGLMELGHFVSGAWSVDPAGITNTPIGSDPLWVGAFAPNSLDSAFVLGNQFSILDFKKSLALTATKVNAAALLNWNVSSIDNVRQFVIEHSSNGRQYAAIHSYNATTALAYNWQHVQMPQGINYYRIKAMNNDGKYVYSNVATVFNSNAGIKLISINPSIINNAAVAIVSAAKTGKISFVISDVAGRKLCQFSSSVVTGDNQIQIPVAAFKAGIYQLTLITDSEREAMHFVKQ